MHVNQLWKDTVNLTYLRKYTDYLKTYLLELCPVGLLSFAKLKKVIIFWPNKRCTAVYGYLCRVCSVHPKGDQWRDEPVVGQFTPSTDAALSSVEDKHEHEHQGLFTPHHSLTKSSQTGIRIINKWPQFHDYFYSGNQSWILLFSSRIRIQGMEMWFWSNRKWRIWACSMRLRDWLWWWCVVRGLSHVNWLSIFSKKSEISSILPIPRYIKDDS